MVGGRSACRGAAYRRRGANHTAPLPDPAARRARVPRTSKRRRYARRTTAAAMIPRHGRLRGIGHLHAGRSIPALAHIGWWRTIAAIDADVHSVADPSQDGYDQERLQRVHKFVLPDDTSEELDCDWSSIERIGQLS